MATDTEIGDIFSSANCSVGAMTHSPVQTLTKTAAAACIQLAAASKQPRMLHLIHVGTRALVLNWEWFCRLPAFKIQFHFSHSSRYF